MREHKTGFKMPQLVKFPKLIVNRWMAAQRAQGGDLLLSIIVF